MPRERQTWNNFCSGTYKPDPKATYTSKDLVCDLVRMRNAWEMYQSRRDRDAIYIYLKRVFLVVRKWFKVGGTWYRAALHFQGDDHPDISDPFAIAIHCSSDQKVVDRKTRSKWSRALRYVHEEKPKSQGLAQFMQAQGGVNACAQAYADSGVNRRAKSRR
jgi:hypothetical protein